MSSVTVLKNAHLPDGKCADITIKDGFVLHTGACPPPECAEIIDCSEYLVLPAAVDMHAHLRGGDKQSAKETWETGSKAALAGGVATVVDQPNTIPAILTADTLKARIDEAARESYCNYAVNGGVDTGCDIKGMYKAGALAFGEIFFAESSFGNAVPPEVIRDAFTEIKALGALASVHAETVESGDDISLAAHDSLRSIAGEVTAIEKVAKLAPEGMRLHICHVSSAESVRAAVKAKASYEVMPHHILLSRENFRDDDTIAKVNPPLRSEKARKELFSMWRSISAVASDSAPHTKTEKALPFKDAPSGIPGTETMVPLLMALAADKKVTVDSIVKKTAINPSRILGILSGGFTKGCRADFALYPRNLEKSLVKIRGDELHSKAGYTPYEGMNAVFPEIVLLRGCRAYDCGEFTKGHAQHIAGTGYIPEQ